MDFPSQPPYLVFVRQSDARRIRGWCMLPKVFFRSSADANRQSAVTDNSKILLSKKRPSEFLSQETSRVRSFCGVYA